VLTGGVYRGLQSIGTTANQGDFPAVFQKSERAGFANTRARARHDCYLCHLNSS
jgi:hypothetical protein